MKATALLAASFLLLLASATRAAGPQSALPSGFGAWTASGAATQTSPGTLENIAGDNAAVLREYGITAAEQGNYARGAETATVTVYRMTDPSAAFGAFTFFRDSQMSGFTAGESATYAAGSRNRALLVVGNLLLDVASPAGRPANQDLKALAGAVSVQASHAPYPTIVGFLPQGGMIAGSARYVLGPQAFAQVFPVGAAGQQDWIGFGKNAEAIIAHYRLGGSDTDSLLLVALYPTQQIAAEKYGDLSGWVALNADGDPAGRPHVFGKRSGALVALLAGANSREEADALLGKIQYSSQVTWNEPTHELTDPSIGTMVVGAIMGTGFIMGLAVAAGIGFGGVRLFVKFLFPGRVFDRREEVEILQLGLSAKPINVEDFYMLDSSRES